MEKPNRKICYLTAINEIEYIRDSIVFLQGQLSTEVPRISLDDLDLNEEDLKEAIAIRKTHHENISVTILKAILIRQVSVLERYIIDTSFAVFEEVKKIEGNTVIYQPSARVTSYDSFSDCLLAANSIQRNLKITIKDSLNWKIFKRTRDIRHKFAHGHSEIRLKTKDADEYNCFFKKPILKFNGEIFIEKNDKAYDDLLIDYQKTKPAGYYESMSKLLEMDKDALDAVITHPFETKYRLKAEYQSYLELNDFFAKLISKIFSAVDGVLQS